MIMPLTVATIGLLGPTAYFSPWVWRQARMLAIRKEVTQNRILALTYDDGPSEVLTPRILELLREYEVRATFFMLGRNAKKYPHIVDRVLQEGHDIGCHSDQHVHAWTAVPWRAIADIDSGYETLAAWLPPDGMFRPPFGKMTLPTYWSIRRRGASVWWWTLDSGDSHKVLPEPEEVVQELLRQNGGIVLLHDLQRSQERDEFVLETTAALLNRAKRESLNILPLREICL